MQITKFTTKNTKETQKIARLFAKEILHSNIGRTEALIVALEGDLGGGKTTFSQGFARGLGIKEKVLSPTFVLMKIYQLPNICMSNIRRFVHIDAYRLKNSKDLVPLGWKDIIKDKQAIILIEWADRVARALPKDKITIFFEFVDEKTRRLRICNGRK